MACVTPDTTVLEAMRVLADKNLGALGVLEEGRLVGMISERDCVRKVELQGRQTADTKVRDIMSTTLTTATPDTGVLDAVDTLMERGIRHLPIMENERVVGILSIRELVEQIAQDQHKLISQLESYISGGYT